MRAKKQLVHLSVHQTSKVFAVLYFLVALICGLLAGIYFFFMGPTSYDALGIIYYMGGLFLMAFLYLIFTYLFIAISCWLYNFVAHSFGGIEFTITDSEN